VSLLERALNLVQMAVSSSLREVSTESAKQLQTKDNTDTAEYILLYGKYETIVNSLGSPVEKLLTTGDFAFEGQKAAYVTQWRDFYNQLVDNYIKSREPVSALIAKKLSKFAAETSPHKDFRGLARRCVQYVFEVCHNELTLAETFFQDGDHWNKDSELAEKIEQNRFSHLLTLHNFLVPHLRDGDLSLACNLIGWLEATYLMSNEDEDYNMDRKRDSQRLTAHVLLEKHLWPLSDGLFLKAAKGMEFFKPTQQDLQVTGNQSARRANKGKAPELTEASESELQNGDEGHSFATPGMENAFPTVKTAVKLLVMYNDRVYDRPVRISPDQYGFTLIQLRGREMFSMKLFIKQPNLFKRRLLL
jgi:hypothetical protein